MTLLFIIFLFIFGTILGSFGGVIIERGKDGFAWNQWGKVFGGRSHCPGCDGKLLTRRQLIPLLGRLKQRGKCYRCHLPIPQWYCWIELGMGVLFVITGLGVIGLDPSPELIVSQGGVLVGRLIVNWLLALILIHDLMTQELNIYAWVMLFVASAIHILTMSESIWLSGFVGAIVLTGVFGTIYMTAKWYATRLNDGEVTEGFGEGDVMVAMLIGLLSGPMIAQWGVVTSIQMMFVYLIVSSSLGIIFFLVSQQTLSLNHQKIPFLPAMIIARRLIAAWSVQGFGLI